jgi:hypothetical protein
MSTPQMTPARSNAGLGGARYVSASHDVRAQVPPAALRSMRVARPPRKRASYGEEQKSTAGGGSTP